MHHACPSTHVAQQRSSRRPSAAAAATPDTGYGRASFEPRGPASNQSSPAGTGLASNRNNLQLLLEPLLAALQICCGSLTDMRASVGSLSYSASTASGLSCPCFRTSTGMSPRSLICCIFTMREGFYCPLRVRNGNEKRRRQTALMSGVGVSEKVHSHDNIDELHTVESS